MLSRILKSTAGKPCSCPEGKICEGCKKKKIVKPQVYIEEPRRLPVSIEIKRYREKPSTAVQGTKRWSIRKKTKVQTKSPVKKTTLCQWYRRRKALNELKSDHQKERRREKQERLERAKREREIEVLEYLRLQADTPVIEKKQKQKEQKPKRVKARTTSAKPRADSKFVSVKQYHRYDTLSNRFVNCCYRICCQFYCYLSCIFIIGFVLIYFL